MDTAPITFRALAEEVLVIRDQQGIRGAEREKSRYRTHIETSTLIDRPITDIAPRDIREWLRWMAQRDEIPRANRLLCRFAIGTVRETIAASAPLPPDTIRDLNALIEEAGHVAA